MSLAEIENMATLSGAVLPEEVSGVLRRILVHSEAYMQRTTQTFLKEAHHQNHHWLLNTRNHLDWLGSTWVLDFPHSTMDLARST